VHELLAGVPAGKLVLAELPSPTHEDVEELERAGVDAVIVRDRELL
jgi:indole-3-glycerol phosphate synthase